jgi:glycerophosphoryl diester phosphodiesterase
MSVACLFSLIAAAASLSLPSPLGACAHRGDSKVAPENTIPAFVSAVEKGAHMIEFDVALTRDGRLVIMHDGTVDRTTNGKGKVADLTFDEIRALDAGSWFSEKFAGTKVPTLEEALEVIPPSIICNVHLKGGATAGDLTARAIRRMNRVGQCVLACEGDAARAARAAVPDIRICNMDRQGNDHMAYAKATVAQHAQFIQLRNAEEGRKEAIDLCRVNGITVNYFRAEDPAKIRRLVQDGVNYILTDDLDTCLRVLKEDFGVAPK